MYFGSVKFFKHLILTVFFGWLAAATILAVYFGVKCYIYEHAAEENGRDPEMLRQYIDEMTEAGFSYDEIATYLDILREGEDNEPKPQNSRPDKDDASDIHAQEPLSNEGSAADSPSQGSAPVTTDYEQLYPELYAQPVRERAASDSDRIYLVFQGVSEENTSDMLTILESHGIKALFIPEGSPSAEDTRIFRQISGEGHSIGAAVPSDKELSDEDYLASFAKACNAAEKASGKLPSLYAPVGYESDSITAELDRRGFIPVNANAAPDDRSPYADWQSVYDDVFSAVDRNSADGTATVLLFHTGREDSLSVLTADDIITDLEAQGYKFALLTPSVYIN